VSHVVLGINAFHADSAACIFVDGRLLFAVEEERLRRVKHWAGFPTESVRHCLDAAKLKISDVDIIAINSDPRSAIGRKVLYAISKRPDPRLILNRMRNATRRRSITEELANVFPNEVFKGKVVGIDHHLAHLASAFYCSPFEEAVAVSVDGFGDFASAAWGLGRSGSVDVDDRIYFPHSLGIFYQALTQYLGFLAYGDEYKVMGLAPYGKPSMLPQMRQIVLDATDGGFRLDLRYFRHHRENVAYQWSNARPEVGQLYSDQLEKLLGPRRTPQSELTDRHRDIAHSIQVRYEEVFLRLLNNLFHRYKTNAVVVAGGCGMNSVANGKIFRSTPFRECYVQAAAGDAGGAIGAALQAHREATGERILPNRMKHAYWGMESCADEIEAVLQSNATDLAAKGICIQRPLNMAAICDMAASSIAAGEVVGWFQGRMEWGPRALGNRSILGDPRRSDMKDILNLKIKRRESFRPFAPSILRDRVGEWFEESADVPFMMQVFQIRVDRRSQIPAVTHVDGSGRLQTVDRDRNPLFFDLISAFDRLTGVPIVLNTSFNENEPIVCRPKEALDCFLRTRMDMLVLGGVILRRSRV
jgi:carbamoyltransferase